MKGFNPKTFRFKGRLKPFTAKESKKLRKEFDEIERQYQEGKYIPPETWDIEINT